MLFQPMRSGRRLTMKDGSLFTPKGMGDDLKTLRDFYGTRGYVDMIAVPEILPAGPGCSRCHLSGGRGRAVLCQSRQYSGQQPDERPRHPPRVGCEARRRFRHNARERKPPATGESELLLRVEMAPADTIVPGRKDLNVIVEEKRTGSFNFGAGFSTIDSLVGFAELQQSNFDLFNWPSFVGGGQRFRIRGQYGLQRKDFVVSLTEPWFLGYKLSVGVEGYYREANFLSDVYDQTNYGMADSGPEDNSGALSPAGWNTGSRASASLTSMKTVRAR